MTNHTNLTQQFFERYTGPFGYYLSENEAGGIFAVECTSTNSYMVAAHDGDELEASEETAKAVAFALNMLASGERQAWTADRLPACAHWLLTKYPGPFCARNGDNNFTAGRDVLCTATMSYVIQENRDWCDTESELVIATIVIALNALRQPRLLDTPRRLLASLTSAG